MFQFISQLKRQHPLIADPLVPIPISIEPTSLPKLKRTVGPLDFLAQRPRQRPPPRRQLEAHSELGGLIIGGAACEFTVSQKESKSIVSHVCLLFSQQCY